jgi:hypothetical protein
MQPIPVALGDSIWLQWTDSTTSQGWEAIKTTLRLSKPSIITSIGWVIKSDEEALTISTSASSYGSCSDPLTIPWVAIRECEELGISLA